MTTMPAAASEQPHSTHLQSDSMVQLITPEGQRVHHPEFTYRPRPGHPDELTALSRWFRDMVLVRRMDVEATALQRHGQLAIWAQLLGQEAAQIGSATALRPQDFAFPTYREHGVAWVRGVPAMELMGLFRGIDHGAWDPYAHNFGNYAIIIGAHALHATGYAMGIALDGEVGTDNPDRDAAAIAYFGDGAMAQGDINEAFVFAAAYQAPVVFYCQNNQYAISQPATGHGPAPLYERAHGFGFPGIQVDGNDVLACHAVTQAALDRARSGQGPTLIEAYTYRMGAHTTTDDPTRYRTEAELEYWRARDPISRVEAYLRSTGKVADSFFTDLEAEADQLGETLRAGCNALPDPDPRRLFGQVFSDPTAELQAQAEFLDQYLASFEPNPSEQVS